MYTGLDISLSAAGFANIDISGKITHCVFGTEKKKFKHRWDRIQAFLDFLEKYLIDTQTKYVVIEDYLINPFVTNNDTTQKLTELGACVRYFLYTKKIPFLTVVGSQLKKYATGNGNSKKAVLIKELYKNYDIDVNDDNEADAIYLAKMCKDIATDKILDKKHMKDTIEKIKKERERINWD